MIWRFQNKKKKQKISCMYYYIPSQWFNPWEQREIDNNICLKWLELLRGEWWRLLEPGESWYHSLTLHFQQSPHPHHLPLTAHSALVVLNVGGQQCLNKTKLYHWLQTVVSWHHNFTNQPWSAVDTSHHHLLSTPAASHDPVLQISYLITSLYYDKSELAAYYLTCNHLLDLII